MPELHKNQIQWQAPDPVHFSLAARQDHLAPQIAELARQAGELSDTIDKINDVELANNLKQTSAAMLHNLKNVQRTDNNYEGVKQEWLSKIQDIYMNAPESARIRFARENPTFMDETVLSADKLIIEKQQRYETVRIGNMIPQMASNVTEGLSSYETERNNLQRMVAALPNEIAEQYMFNFDDQIIKDKVDDLISAHRFQDALDMLDDVKGSYTLSPSYRNNKRNLIQNTINQIRAEQQQELNRLQKENAGIEKVNADIAAGGTGAVGSSTSSGTAESKIEKAEQNMIQKWVDDIAMNSPEVLPAVLKAIQNPSDEITRLPNGQYIQGRFAYSADGTQLWSLNDIEPGVIIDAIHARMPKVNDLPQRIDEVLSARNSFDKLEDIFLEKKKDGEGESAYNALIELDKAASAPEAYTDISQDRLRELRAYSEADLDALAAAAGSYETIGQTVNYTDIATDESIASTLATGAAAGMALGGKLAGPLGIAPGALIGAAVGVYEAAHSRYNAVSGQEAIRQGWRAFEKQDESELEKINKKYIEEHPDLPLPRIAKENPQFDPTKTPGYNGLNKAQKLLRDPVYALRTGIDATVQYLKDEWDIDIVPGSFGEALVGQYVAIKIEDARGLEDLGLSPMLLGSRKIPQAFRETLTDLRNNKFRDINPTQVPSGELDEFNKESRALFDIMFLRLQGNVNVELTDEQKANREKLFEFIRVGTDINGPLGAKYALKRADGEPKNYMQTHLDRLVKQGIKRRFKA